MSRLAGVLIPVLAFVVFGCGMASDQTVAAAEAGKDAAKMGNEQKSVADTTETEKIVKSDEEWRKQLTAEQFRVTRQCGTEPAFTGKYWNEKRDGTYVCVACGQPLFDSETKYDSGTGWPSFYAPVDKKVVEEREDKSLFATRTEILCSRCEAHLGHVFTDGPNPTGLRYCMNSASLNFVPEDQKDAAKSGEETEKAKPENATHETSEATPAE